MASVGHLTAGLPRAQQCRRAWRDDPIARTMRKPDRTKLPAVAALLLSSDLRLLLRHEGERPLSVRRMMLAGHVCDEGRAVWKRLRVGLRGSY